MAGAMKQAEAIRFLLWTAWECTHQQKHYAGAAVLGVRSSASDASVGDWQRLSPGVPRAMATCSQ